MTTRIPGPRLRSGVIVIATYWAVTYLFPLVGNQVMGSALTSSYRLYPPSAVAIAEIFGTLALWLVLEQMRFRVPRLPMSLAATWSRLGSEYRHYRLFIALAALGASAAGLASGLSGWRYAGAISNDVSSPVIPFIALNAVVTLDVFHSMFVEMRPRRRPRWRRRATDCVMALALLLASNGVLSAFIGLTALFWALFPRGFRRIVFVPPGHYTVARIAKICIAVVALSVTFCVAWVVGNVIKSSSTTSLRTIAENPQVLFEYVLSGDAPLASAVAYVVERQSVHYYSLLYTTAVPRPELEPDGHSVVLYPLRTLAWRFSYLAFGQGEARPSVGSVMQLNYRLLVDGPPSDRAGTSPGLIAAFNYVFPPVLAVLAAALYLRCLSPRLGVLFYQQGGARLSLIGALLAVQFVAVLFQSPFDLLIVIDDGFLWAAALFLFSSVKLRQLRRASARMRPAFVPPAAPSGTVLDFRPA